MGVAESIENPSNNNNDTQDGKLLVGIECGRKLNYKVEFQFLLEQS